MLPEIGEVDWREHRARVAERLEEAGAPREVAWAHALTPELMQAPDVIGVAERTGRPVEDVTRAFHRLAARARHRLAARRARRPPAAHAHAALGGPGGARGLPRRARRAGLLRARAASPTAAAPDAVDAYLEERAALTRRLHAVTASLTIEGTGDLPALMLAVRALRALAG